MLELKNLLGRTGVAVGVILLATVTFLPNVLEQQLVVGFHTRLRQANGKKIPVETGLIKDFIEDRENGLHYYFPDAKCIFEAGDDLPKTHRCVLTDRFITTARVNSLTQAFPNIVNDTYTYVAPHSIEKFFGNFSRKKAFKNLKVKLGLDLQGGMRAVFQADFDGYVERQKEKVEPLIKSKKDELALVKDPIKSKELQTQINELEDSLVLDKIKKKNLLTRSKIVLAKRLTSQGLTEPELRVQEASYSISVDMPGVANSTEVLNRLGDTVHVEYRIVNDKKTESILSNSQNVEDLRLIRKLHRKKRVDPDEIQDIIIRIAKRSTLKKSDGRLFLEWSAVKEGGVVLPSTILVLGPPALDGEDMRDAGVGLAPNSSYYMINFLTNARGEAILGDLTTKNIGKRMAILWGDRVVSAPTIQGRISSQGQITGSFTQSQANEIASVIKDGALPVELKVLSVNFIGPSLGQASIITGMISILLGFVVVIFFMIGYYRASGFIAVVALFLNIVLMAAIMSLFEFTLTLPGFAGVILTIGMAVDASVIIFEKIKEDIRAGKSASVAIENGFESSLWTIMDANVTTLIAAIILWMSKDGPIMGFALVLFFGLLSSMFTALYISRLLFDWSQYLLRYQKLSIAWGTKPNQVEGSK